MEAAKMIDGIKSRVIKKNPKLREIRGWFEPNPRGKAVKPPPGVKYDQVAVRSEDNLVIGALWIARREGMVDTGTMEKTKVVLTRKLSQFEEEVKARNG